MKMKLLKSSVILLVAMVFISLFMGFPAAAQELPRLEVRPAVIEGVNVGDDVAVEIWATNVPEWEIVGFEFSVPFNTQWLAPEMLEHGTFMEEFVNGGEIGPVYVSVSDIAYKPDWNLTKAMVWIAPAGGGQYYEPFPSGEGRLVTLHYTAIKNNVAMPIDIIDITIIDRYIEELPYETPLSGAYIAGALSDLNVELIGWKFKVNGKAGVGIGHKSTVGAVNTLEVLVDNTGTIDVYVQATFLIQDASHTPYATTTSASVLLPAGQSTLLSATWTADLSGHYYLSGTVYYGPLYDYTRTQTLRIDVTPPK